MPNLMDTIIVKRWIRNTATPRCRPESSNVQEGNMKPYVPGEEEVFGYGALSYCWGYCQNFTTTKASLPNYILSIDFNALPRTLKDAVTTTRNLGLRYLWVDALCIVQDDREDKDAEITRMGNVYQNAIITIVAANSPGVECGFLDYKPLPKPVPSIFRSCLTTRS
ncbi:uncharacterized protein PAC_04034 [Phialocephala subalpina]|uniref:Heterokaryon incompatibility domain-containing protein n=1 Tax=Phialocephala subalpina TaxID=576137 RepID=A0A1L7WN00_9HELO|nr:uncharacterized protein PAC_04034 [Phialocephala subalpina]